NVPPCARSTAEAGPGHSPAACGSRAADASSKSMPSQMATYLVNAVTCGLNSVSWPQAAAPSTEKPRPLTAPDNVLAAAIAALSRATTSPGHSSAVGASSIVAGIVLRVLRVARFMTKGSRLMSRLATLLADVAGIEQSFSTEWLTDDVRNMARAILRTRS